MPKPLRVLNIEDSESDSVLLERHLRRNGYDLYLQRVQSAEEFVDVLRDGWDVIISDFSIPGFSGPAALKIMQRERIDLPFLIMSGTVGEEAAVEALKAGAHDFFSKDKLTRLVPAIERELREALQRRQRRDTEFQLQSSQERLRLAVDAAKLGIWSWNPKTNEVLFDENYHEVLYHTEPTEAIRDYTTFLSLIHADDRDRVDQIFQKAAETNQTVDVEFRIADDIWLASRAKYFDREGARYVIGVLQDITDRKLSQIAEHEQRLLAETLRDTAVDINSTLDLEQSLNYILANMERVIPFTTSDIMLIDENEKSRVICSRGYKKRNLDTIYNRIEFSLSSMSVFKSSLETGEPYVIDDINQARHILQLTDDDWLCSYAGVPIFLKERVVGFLNATSAEIAFFNPQRILQMQSFSELAATAIQNSRLQEQAEELVATKERQRIARELHDAVNQTLFSASILTETLLKTLHIDLDKARELLEEVHKLTKGAIAEMRSLLLELRPDQLIQGTMNDHLRLLIRALESRKRIETHLDVQGDYAIPSDVKIVFYRIAQETLTNVLRHADAARIDIRYSADQQLVELLVSDDGIGFDTQKVTRGLGLQSMRERASEINANLEIHSSAGTGTTLILRWSPVNV